MINKLLSILFFLSLVLAVAPTGRIQTERLHSLVDLRGNYQEIAKLYASDAQAGDRFGTSIAVSADTLVVGAYLEDGGTGDPITDAGAVYVFKRDPDQSGKWVEVARLSASDAQSGDLFGNSVAISGDTIVVGAVNEDGDGDPWSDAGAAYVFERDLGGPGNWGQSAKLTAGDAQPGYRFGGAVAIEGDTIVAGATGAEAIPGNPFPISGAAYVFERDLGGPGSWGEAARLIASDAQDGDGLGASVDISGDTIVAGAWLKDAVTENFWLTSGQQSPKDVPGGFGNQGAAYVFERDLGGPEIWGEASKLVSFDAQDMDIFGVSVTIDGDTIVVGSDSEDGGPGNPMPDSGAAYVFERDEMGSWSVVTKLVAGDAQEMDHFGNSVTIYGEIIVVGAPLEDGGPGDPVNGVGAAYLFKRDEGGPENWGEIDKLLSSDGQEFDSFGSWGSIAISNDFIVIGADGEDGGTGDPLPNTGAAYVFMVGENKIFMPIVLKN